MTEGMQVPSVTFKYRVRTDGHPITYVNKDNGGETFVMRQWMIHQGVEKLQFIPDGTGEFTEKMGMLVCKDNLGFGNRSWRYAMVVNDGVVEKAFIEEGKEDNCPTDPYGVSSPETVMAYLETVTEKVAEPA
jgi:peroxiredoxin